MSAGSTGAIETTRWPGSVAPARTLRSKAPESTPGVPMGIALGRRHEPMRLPGHKPDWRLGSFASARRQLIDSAPISGPCRIRLEA